MTSYLTCVEIEPSTAATASVLWLHGLGADGHDFEPIVPELRLPRDAGVRFVFPNAPAIPVTINGGMVMPAWYDILALDIGRHVDEQQLRQSADAVAALVDREIERGIDSRRIVVAGFSQGGAVAYQLALSDPRPLAGLLVLSAYFPTARTIRLHRRQPRTADPGLSRQSRPGRAGGTRSPGAPDTARHGLRRRVQDLPDRAQRLPGGDRGRVPLVASDAGTEIAMTAPDAEALAARLAEHPDYRVLRRLDVAREWPAVTGRGAGFAVVLDTETTGMDPATDKVIELALVKFEYSRESGAIGRVFDAYDGLEDPGMPIPPESTAIHHITDDMVRGQRLDEAAIGRVLEGAGLVIAHNAGFDRPFVEARLPAFRSLPWACSLRGRAVGQPRPRQRQARLSRLPLRFLLRGASRRDRLPGAARGAAPADPRARRAVGRALRAGPPRFACCSIRPGSPRAASGPRDRRSRPRTSSGRAATAGRATGAAGMVTSRASRLDEELAWLKKNVYGGRVASVEVETFDARTRYSGRNGNKERVTV